MGVSRYFFLAAVCVLAGCARPQADPALTSHPAVIVWDGKSNLTLNEIPPIPKLDAPATQPTTRPSVEALVLYTQSCEATARHQPQVAIDLLNRAISIDPGRFNLYFDLGRAYASECKSGNSAIAAFTQAAAIQPDSVEAQTELGRLYRNESNPTAALLHLRLATLTPGYAAGDSRALLVDYMLARTLKQLGYDRAALDEYTRVIAWLQDPSQSLPRNPELSELLNRPNSLLEEIAELLEKHGDYADALKALKTSVAAEPDNFELQSRYARDLAFDGQRDAALAKAVDLVLGQRASPQSLQTLRSVCRSLNIQDGSVTTLRKLYVKRPNDHAVLFALADTLISRNRTTEAWDLLQNAWQNSPGDVELTRRLFLLDKQQEQIGAAAELLIHGLATNPHAISNYVPLWTELLSYSQPKRLQVASLELMQLAPEDEAARQVWISVTAEHDTRFLLQQLSLEKATRYTPPFGPAFRSLIQILSARPDLTQAQRAKSIEELIAMAQNSGDSGLAAELRGIWFASENQLENAAGAFAEASRLGDNSPECTVAAADIQLRLGRNAQYEQMLWKVTRDFPFYAGSYEALETFNTAPATASADQAAKVLSSWRANDPQSAAARLLQAQNAAELGRNVEADQLFASLFAEDPDYPPVLRELVQFYRHSNRVDDLIGKLEAAGLQRPRDTDLAARLAVVYAGQNRRAEAVRLLDNTRGLVADDADQLYSLVDTYLTLDQMQTAQEVLLQVIQLDPTHSGACNGLGFEWADDGKNLPKAEALIRIALAQEPDNVRFLDSLGWVLYKRGDMEAARLCLGQAVAPMPIPNPVVMDHLGDVLYRMSRREQALGNWEQSLKALSDDHPDQRKLRLQLLQKIKQAEANQPVKILSGGAVGAEGSSPGWSQP